MHCWQVITKMKSIIVVVPTLFSITFLKLLKIFCFSYQPSIQVDSLFFSSIWIFGKYGCQYCTSHMTYLIASSILKIIFEDFLCWYTFVSLQLLHGEERGEKSGLLLSLLRPSFKNPSTDVTQTGSQLTLFLAAPLQAFCQLVGFVSSDEDMVSRQRC